MKIAMVAPVIEAVPPLLYGGTERVVSTLTEELVRRGHDVTLFASGDSRTAARLIPCAERALRLEDVLQDLTTDVESNAAHREGRVVCVQSQHGERFHFAAGGLIVEELTGNVGHGGGEAVCSVAGWDGCK